MQPLLYFASVDSLQKQLRRLMQIRARLFDGRTLAGNVQVRTQGDVPIALAFDDRGQLMCSFHAALLVLRSCEGPGLEDEVPVAIGTVDEPVLADAEIDARVTERTV